MRTDTRRILRLLSAVALAAGFMVAGVSTASAAGPDVTISMSGSGSNAVDGVCGGYHAVYSVTLTGTVTPGGPIAGTAQSEYTFMGCGEPNSYVLTVRGGTILAHTTVLNPGQVSGSPQVLNVTGTLAVDSGTGRFTRIHGGTLSFSYTSTYEVGANFPFGNTTLTDYTISGTLTG
jgi:hypothetical protein